MKTLLVCVISVLLSLLFANTSALTIQQLKNMAKMPRSMCMQRTGASKENVEKIQVGEFVDDPKTKCYMKCAMSMMSVMKNGKYSAEAATNQANKMLPDDYKDRVKASIQKCKDMGNTADDCENAFLITKCNYEADKDVFLFP
ncbi:general odorant-binding protein 72 [Anabrus simplex]|uniref:general odorant-binding protein 72 n=1 Tax=Anabrus simplex TaxID=316456 RepID=UPI0035A32797